MTKNLTLEEATRAVDVLERDLQDVMEKHRATATEVGASTCALMHEKCDDNPAVWFGAVAAAVAAVCNGLARGSDTLPAEIYATAFASAVLNMVSCEDDHREKMN